MSIALPGASAADGLAGRAADAQTTAPRSADVLPARARGKARNHPVVRVTHWIAAVAIVVMVGSGLQIFNAYPSFHRKGEPPFPLWPFEGHQAPHWSTFGGWLAGGRMWHFAMMWVLVLNGLVYLGFVYLHGEWRDLVPRRGDIRDTWQMIKFYTFTRPDHPLQGKHNALQKSAYFALMLVVIALAAAHVFMVFAVDPYAIRSMTTGGYDGALSPEERNARPFYHLLPRYRDWRERGRVRNASGDVV